MLAMMITSKQRGKESLCSALTDLAISDRQWEDLVRLYYSRYPHAYYMDTEPLRDYSPFQQHFQQSLSDIWSFVDSYFNVYLPCMFQSGSVHVSTLRAAADSFSSSYRGFIRGVGAMGIRAVYISETQHQVSKRVTPVTVLTDRALTTLQDVCAGLIESTTITSEVDRTTQAIQVIESSTYGGYYWKDMLHYLSRCASLVHCYGIDLGNTCGYLENIAYKQRTQICKYHREISNILGSRDVMKALPFQVCQTDSLQHTPSEVKLTELSLIPWYSFIVLFLGLSKGHSLQLELIYEHLSQHMYEQMNTDVSIKLSATVITNMALGAHTQIENLKTRFTDSCSAKSPQLALIQNLLSV